MNLQVIVNWLQARLDSNDQRGAALVEYGLLVALIAAVCIGILVVLGPRISNEFSSIYTALG